MGSLQEFIWKRRQLGHIPTARFTASMSFFGWNNVKLLEDIDFSLASINLPTVRGNYEQAYYDTMPVEIFKNFTFDPDFSMTVICDNKGEIYKEFMKLVQHDKDNVVGTSGAFHVGYEGNFNFKQKVEPDIHLTVTALADSYPGNFQHSYGSGENGLTVVLAGVYIKGLGNLDFSNIGSDIISFSVNASATSFEVNPSMVSIQSSSPASQSQNSEDVTGTQTTPTPSPDEIAAQRNARADQVADEMVQQWEDGEHLQDAYDETEYWGTEGVELNPEESSNNSEFLPQTNVSTDMPHEYEETDTEPELRRTSIADARKNQELYPEIDVQSKDISDNGSESTIVSAKPSEKENGNAEIKVPVIKVDN